MPEQSRGRHAARDPAIADSGYVLSSARAAGDGMWATRGDSVAEGDTRARGSDTLAEGSGASPGRHAAVDGDSGWRPRVAADSSTARLNGTQQPNGAQAMDGTQWAQSAHPPVTTPPTTRPQTTADIAVLDTIGDGWRTASDTDWPGRPAPTVRTVTTGPKPPTESTQTTGNPHTTASPEPTQAAQTSAHAAPAIEVRNLRKVFGDNVAVDDVSFSVPAGKVLAVLGPNGAGKTTTVNMLCTLLKPDAGSATVAGHDITDNPAGVRRAITLTGQFAALDEALSGRENLVLFGRLLGLGKKRATERAAELLEMFGLTGAAERKVHEYSGGMRRRIDIACGLVTSPEVVFLDEPTTGLDPRSRHEVWSLVSRLRESGVTTLLTTQYLEEADVLSDSIVVIDHGRVIAEGTSDELKSQTGGTVCEVTPTFAEDIPRLTELLSDLIRRSKDSTQTSEDETDSIAVPAPDGTQTLVEVVRRCTEAKIELSDVVMRKPSLDEVFLDLTAPSQDADA